MQQGSVTINTPDPAQPQDQEAHDAAMVQRYEAGQQAAEAGLSHVPPQETPQETPQVEPTAPVPAPQSEAQGDFVDTLVASAGLSRDKLTEEYLAGGLSEASYKALEAKGVNREAVDSYLNGLKAQGQQANAEYESSVIQATVGTPEVYQELTTWAAENLTPEEKNTFNQAVSSGNKALAELTIKGLFAQYKAANPAEPQLISQGTPSGGALAFESWAQVRTEMQRPEYKTDPAFRERVRQRLAVSGGL